MGCASEKMIKRNTTFPMLVTAEERGSEMSTELSNLSETMNCLIFLYWWSRTIWYSSSGATHSSIGGLRRLRI